jgi:hypothetical protein
MSEKPKEKRGDSTVVDVSPVAGLRLKFRHLPYTAVKYRFSSNSVKRPQPNPHSRKIPPQLALAPSAEELAKYEKYAEYVGSSEHKSAPWHGLTAGSRREKNANRRPTYLSKEQATAMLKAGIRAGNISEDFDGELPKRVWYKGTFGSFEARLTDRADIESGKPAGYKGWPESQEQLPSKPRAVRVCDEI